MSDAKFDNETPTQEHARFDLHFHAERYVAGEREGGLEAAALEYACACGWVRPDDREGALAIVERTGALTAVEARRVLAFGIDLDLVPELAGQRDQLLAVLQQVVFSLERNDPGRAEGRMPQKADWEVALSMAKAALGHEKRKG